MAWEDRKVLAVVPARGGSKRLPRKNLRKVGGLSLIAHAARTALELDWIDRAVLSTDDEEMAEEGRRHGLDVPFLRPAELAGDLSSSIEMWRHAWLASEAHYGCTFDLSLLLQPTTPLRRREEVERCVRTLVEGGHQAATTVSRVPSHFTPEKTLQMDEAGRLRFYLPEGSRHSEQQTIPTYYYRNGLAYAVTRNSLIEKRTIIGGDCAGVLIEREVVNIDEPFELELARFMLERESKSRRSTGSDR